MPDAIWIDRSEELPALARELESQESIGVDTEFLRESTFFPIVALIQISTDDESWLVDPLALTGRVARGAVPSLN